MSEDRRKRLHGGLWLALGLLLMLAVSLWVAHHTQAELLSHSAFDSYAKQAMAWRDGRLKLDQDYPWLELAIYEGDYYVSFPPVPTIPMWLLSFFMGENTPSGLMTLLYFLLAYVALFLLCQRHLPPGQAMLCAAFALLGGSALDIAVSGGGFSGGVWFQAQLLGLLFTSLAILLVDGPSRGGWAAGLICIALAVGCRPFNALYVPALLWLLWQKLPSGALWHKLRAMALLCAVPLLIACAYGVYNYARFGNPLEFGHSYLPELAQAGEGMFVPARIADNLRNILRPMQIAEGRLTFPTVSGFAVYLTCPLLLLSGARTGERAVARRFAAVDAILWVTVLLHALLLLSHRTNGGWQYGTRYFVDLLPALVYLFVRGGARVRRWEAALMGALMAVNAYATIVFHFL